MVLHTTHSNTQQDKLLMGLVANCDEVQPDDEGLAAHGAQAINVLHEEAESEEQDK